MFVPRKHAMFRARETCHVPCIGNTPCFVVSMKHAMFGVWETRCVPYLGNQETRLVSCLRHVQYLGN